MLVAVLIVSTALAVPPASRVIVLGFRARLGLFGPLGVIVAARLTIPLNPPWLVNVRVELPDDPWEMVMDAGLADMRKSDGGGIVICRNVETLWASFPLVPLMVKV